MIYDEGIGIGTGVYSTVPPNHTQAGVASSLTHTLARDYNEWSAPMLIAQSPSGSLHRTIRGHARLNASLGPTAVSAIASAATLAVPAMADFFDIQGRASTLDRGVGWADG